LTAHGIHDNGDGSYRITGKGIDFDYFVQIGNKGTWSTAHVDVTAPPEAPAEVTPHLSGIELLNNWNFEQDNANNANGFVSVDTVAGWTNEAGGSSPLEVQHQKFGFVTGFADGEEQWLDTSASPGNVHIGQEVNVSTGQRPSCLSPSPPRILISSTARRGTRTSPTRMITSCSSSTT
jgi:hypothetical protein